VRPERHSPASIATLRRHLGVASSWLAGLEELLAPGEQRCGNCRRTGGVIAMTVGQSAAMEYYEGAVEQMFEHGGLDRLAGIRNFNAHLLPVPHNAHVDLRTRLAMLDRVHQQIRAGATEQRAVHMRRGVAMQPRMHASFFEWNLQKLQRVCNFSRQRYFNEARCALALVGSREEQHVVDDRAHSFEFFEIRL